MKLAIIFTAFLGLVFAVVPVAAQNNLRQIGLASHVYYDAALAGQRESLVITYTGLEDSPVQLFEANVPATSAAECLATTEFTNLVPISADRTAQTYVDGKRIVIVQTPAESFGRCHVIVGTSGDSNRDFNVWRSNFGSVSGFRESDPEAKDQLVQARRSTSGPIYRIGRRFPE